MGCSSSKQNKGVEVTEQCIDIPIVGLDGAGKTTILKRLKTGEIKDTAPTDCYDLECLSCDGVELIMWDFSGSRRTILENVRTYFRDVKAILFVVDSADTPKRLHEAIEMLNVLLEREKDAILLVYANKQDKEGALNAEKIKAEIDPNYLGGRKVRVQAASAFKNDGEGYVEGLEWLIQQVKKI